MPTLSDMPQPNLGHVEGSGYFQRALQDLVDAHNQELVQAKELWEPPKSARSPTLMVDDSPVSSKKTWGVTLPRTPRGDSSTPRSGPHAYMQEPAASLPRQPVVSDDGLVDMPPCWGSELSDYIPKTLSDLNVNAEAHGIHGSVGKVATRAAKPYRPTLQCEAEETEADEVGATPRSNGHSETMESPKRVASHISRASHASRRSDGTKLRQTVSEALAALPPEEPDEVEQDDDDASPCRAGSRSTKTLAKHSIYTISNFRGWRHQVASVVVNTKFDSLFGAVITLNVVIMILETDRSAPCAGLPDLSSCKSDVFTVINAVFLMLYTVEIVLRFYVFRLTLFYSSWNVLDFSVVVLGYVDMVLAHVWEGGMPGPSLSLLRIFRVFRLVRAVRIFQTVPELYSMMRGFQSAVKSMIWGFVMIIVVMMLFAVLTVELIHPVSVKVNADNEYCLGAFDSVWHCVLMFFQTLVAGDSWGYCALPIVKDQFWTFAIFSLALICVQLGFMNLILAVIVEHASQAREDDLDNKRKEKTKQERKATRRLEQLFWSIDADGSGTISLEELLEGYDENQDMQNLFKSLDMTRPDLEMIFDLMDTDNTGELSHEYLIENLRTSQLDDTRKSITILRLQANEIARAMKRIQHDPHTSQIARRHSGHDVKSKQSTASQDAMSRLANGT